MKIIVHRRNTLAELQATDSRYGVEVDIRSDGEDLIIQHDPFFPGELFAEWLRNYKHGTLILNVKEDGLEERLLKITAGHGVDDFFFLDQSFPAVVRWSKEGERRCAIRISEYESIETAMALAGKIEWVWVDFFTHLALSNKEAIQLRSGGFKLCLVSPELQGHNATSAIPALASILSERGILADAVCTKRPDIWESIL